MPDTATSPKSRRRSGKPPIHLLDADYNLIADLALSIERRSPELSKMLLDEIDRAQIHQPGKLPAGTVSLGSDVEFLDVETGTTRRAQLVLPIDADIDAGRLSILTPVGAGLIGLAKGQSIDWPCPSGRPRVLRILNVARPSTPDEVHSETHKGNTEELPLVRIGISQKGRKAALHPDR